MRIRRFHPWVEEQIAKSPAVASARAAEIPGEPPFVTHVAFEAGGQIFIHWVGTSPPGGDHPDNPEEIVTGAPPESVEVPDLATTGRLKTADIELHLAALINNGGHHELAEVGGYTQIPDRDPGNQPYGLRIRCHSGAMIYGLFRHTLSRSQQPTEQSEFAQREAV
jgi:hypothetical protein